MMWDVIIFIVVYLYFNIFIKVVCIFFILLDLLYDFFWNKNNIFLNVFEYCNWNYYDIYKVIYGIDKVIYDIYEGIYDIYEGIYGVIGWMDVN